MRRLLVLTALLTLALTASAASQTVRPRIVGGSTVTNGDYPWQVALMTAGGQQYCGGTLVAPRYVLTAEHCEPRVGEKVRAGSYDRTEGGTVLLVADVFHHPNADPGGSAGVNLPWFAPRYDVNIVKLSGSVPHAEPLAVVDAAQTALWAEGAELTITGWGRTTSGGSSSQYLQEARVPAVSDATCTSAYIQFVQTDMFCAGYAAGGVDTCQGDSGGPIIAPTVASPDKREAGDWRLVGVTSWGGGCGAPNSPSVYARLGEPLVGDWVRDTLAAMPAHSEREDVPAPEVDELPDAEPPVPAPPAPTATPRATVATTLAVKRRCTRRRRCTLTITPTGDVASVRVTVATTTTRSCRRGGKRTTCKRTTSRTLRVRKTAGSFSAATGALRKGAHTVTVTATGAATKRLRFSLR